LTNFTINHLAKTELTAQLGYWNGTGWVDRYVWNPGNRAPLVSFTLIPSGTIGGTVNVLATVTNGVGLSRVDFYLDGSLMSSDTNTSDNVYSWAWDTRTVAQGPHTLEAVAFDSVGNQVLRSNAVTVDNAAPSVTIVEPPSGAAVYGYVEIRVSASDSSGVSVRYYIDSVLRATVSTPGVDGYYHWTWDARDVTPGTQHTILAEAVDPAGNTASHGISVTITQNPPPTVEIVLPADGATVSGSVKVLASASDNDGISRVDFYRDGGWRYTDYISPYSWAFDTTQANNGWHSLTAVAVDTEGGYASDTIRVYVNNEGGGCPEPPCPTGAISATSTTTVGSEALVVVPTGVWTQGSNHTVQVDLRKGVRDLTTSEIAEGLLGPGFSAADFHQFTAWRLTVKDWVAGNSGTLWDYFLKTQETSDPAMRDTDGDGLNDSEELNLVADGHQTDSRICRSVRDAFKTPAKHPKG